MPMMGIHDTQGGSSQRLGNTIVKEFHKKDMKISLEIPPLLSGEEISIIIRINDITGNKPVSGAKVISMVQRLEQSGHLHAPEPIGYKTKEIYGKGLYISKHRFEKDGLHEITVKVMNIEGNDIDPPIVISTIQKVGHQNSQDIKSAFKPMVILGGIAMVAMMVFMML